MTSESRFNQILNKVDKLTGKIKENNPIFTREDYLKGAILFCEDATAEERAKLREALDKNNKE